MLSATEILVENVSISDAAGGHVTEQSLHEESEGAGNCWAVLWVISLERRYIKYAYKKRPHGVNRRGRMYAPTLAEDQAGQIESIAWETMKKKCSLWGGVQSASRLSCFIKRLKSLILDFFPRLSKRQAYSVYLI